jgi:hydrogenase expression/formation protein HypE
MAEIPQYGKVTKDFFDRVIYPRLGAKRNEIVVGPSSGVDTCAVKIGTGEVLVSTTDPLSYIPELGPASSAWLSVNLIASDISTSGFHPQYMILDFNLPPSMTDSTFESYWNALSSECERQGIAIIGGHTGRFEGIDSTVIGGGVIFSIGSEREYLTSAGGKPSHELIVTKGAAIAATGIFSQVFPEKIAEKIGRQKLAKAQQYFRRITVVQDALLASSKGVRISGVSAMHDATEGGVLSAIYELASASSCGALVEKAKIPISDETKEVCDLFDIDPYQSLGEGALVISCAPERAQFILNALISSEINAAIVGELTDKAEGINLIENGVKKPIPYPIVDPYWSAYYSAKKRGWH